MGGLYTGTIISSLSSVGCFPLDDGQPGLLFAPQSTNLRSAKQLSRGRCLIREPTLAQSPALP